MRFRYAGVLVSAALLVGCGGSDGPTNPGGAGGLTATQTTLIGVGGGGPLNAYQLTEATESNVAQAIEAASVAAGGTTLVTTGTLTQHGTGSGSTFTWSAQPTDHMVVNLSGYPAFNITVAAAVGYTGGDYKDFLDSHSDFRFHVTAANLMDLQVTSQAGAPAAAARDGARPLGTANRTVVYLHHSVGTVVLNGTTYNLDLTNNGGHNDVVDSGFAEVQTADHLSGSIVTTQGRVDINEVETSHTIYGSNTLASTYSTAGNSQITVGNDVFLFQNVQYSREFTDGAINQPNFWTIGGQLLKNGIVIGQVAWNKTPTEGTSSANQPYPVVKLAAGGQIDL